MSGKTPNIYEALKPVLFFSKIVGLYPNKIQTGPTDSSHKRDNLDMLWSVALNTFLAIYAASTIRMGDKPAVANEMIIQIGDRIYLTVSLLNSFVIAGATIANRKKMVSLFRKLYLFDKRIRFLQPPVDLKKEQARARACTILAAATVAFLIVAYLVVDVCLFLDEVTFYDVGAEVVAYVYPLTTMLTMISQFGTVAMLIRQKFKWINLKLKQVRYNWQRTDALFSYTHVRFLSPAVYRNSDKTIYFLEQLRREHYQLCSLAQDLNRIFSVPILVTVLNLFISITFTIYFYFISDSNAKARRPLLYSVYYVLNGLINCGALFSLVSVSSSTKNAAKLTSYILHTIYDATEEMENYIIHFSFQLLENEVEFTGCSVFVLDEKLLFSIVGAIATYLVIVVQFHSGLD